MTPSYPIPDRIARVAVALRGEEGRQWFARLPETVAACAERWQLALDPPYECLSINYAAPGRDAQGRPIVLKVCIPGDEFSTEAAALRLYDGRGSIRLWGADLDRGALLIERAAPGASLDTVADDVEATHIACEVMRQLWRPVPAASAKILPTYDLWVQHMGERYQARLGPEHALLRRWVERALAMHRELAADQPAWVLLHGDLHHGNILAAERQPWLAIDPKGLAGPAIAETGPLLINRLAAPHTPETARRALGRRADQLADELGYDRQTLRAWGVVRAVMSAWWTVEDNSSDWQSTMICAEGLGSGAMR